MKYLSILSLIIFVVVISGCIGQTPIIVSTKDGVVITDFSFEYSPIYAEDNVGLRLELQNVGGDVGELKKIMVYGVDFTGGGSTEYGWGTGRDGDVVLEKEKIGDGKIIRLYPPNPEIDFEGGKYYHEWRVQAPKGIASKTTYEFFVRVEYDYTTTYSGTIRVIDETYLRSLKEEEKQKLFESGGIVSSELTNGPISIIPFSGRHFIVDDVTPQPRPIKFKVENVGKGYPFIDDKLYYIRIKDIKGDVIVNCSQEDNWKIKLSRGKSHIIECEFQPPGTNDFTNKVDKMFQITFEYSYGVDDSTSIVVNPAY